MNNNISENNDKLFKLYILSELAYENQFKNFIASKDALYPKDWYATKNYKEKIEIIAEAIKTNNLITNTSKYQNIIKNKKSKILNNKK